MEDMEDIAYLNTLMESICSAFSGVMHGLYRANKGSIDLRSSLHLILILIAREHLYPHLQVVLQLVACIATFDYRSDNLCVACASLIVYDVVCSSLSLLLTSQ